VSLSLREQLSEHVLRIVISNAIKEFSFSHWPPIGF
jgi:hypothetical protein